MFLFPFPWCLVEVLTLVGAASAATALPPGYAFEWSGPAQQLAAAGLVQAILLSVIVALFGAVAAVAVVGSDINLIFKSG